MLSKYLNVNHIRYKKRISAGKVRYVIKTPLGRTLSEILQRVKDIQVRLLADEFAVIPIARSGKFTIALVVTPTVMKWRIAHKTGQISIESKDDVIALAKIIEKLQGVVT